MLNNNNKIKVGLVTAWGECGMGYLAKNWVYTLNKFLDEITGISKIDVEKIYQMYQKSQHKRILPERV